MSHIVRDEDESTHHSLDDQPIIHIPNSSAPTVTTPASEIGHGIIHLIEPDEEESASILSESNHNETLRRSNRRRIQPLRFWENERQIYAPHSEVGVLGEEMGDMPVVIGVERRSGNTYYQPIETDDEYYSYEEGGSVGTHSQVSGGEYSIKGEDVVVAADEVHDYDTSREEVVSTLARLIREEYGPPPDRSAHAESDSVLQSVTNDGSTSIKKTEAQRCNSQSAVQRPRSFSRARRQSRLGCSLLVENDSSCYSNEENNLNILTERLKHVNITTSNQENEQIKQLQKDNKYFSDCLQCPICHEVKIDNMYLMRCNHRVCGDCALHLDHCHSCRAPRVNKGWLKKIYY